MRAIGITLLLGSLLLGGCSSGSLPIVTSPDTPRPTYVAGDVIVGFYDNVDEQEADAMFTRHGLTWTSGFSKNFSVWAEVVSGSPAEHVSRLSESPIVAWAEQRGSDILVLFNETASVESAQALINADPGLRVRSVVLPPKWGLVHVEPGTEQAWIETLQKEPTVRYAQLNHILYPTHIAAPVAP